MKLDQRGGFRCFIADSELNNLLLLLISYKIQGLATMSYAWLSNMQKKVWLNQFSGTYFPKF